VNSTLAMVLGLLALVVGAIGLAYKLGKKQGSAEGDKKLDEARKAGWREYRKDSMEGQGIQEDTFNMPIEDVRAELKRRAGK
jgi:hypothetical protein